MFLSLEWFKIKRNLKESTTVEGFDLFELNLLSLIYILAK